MSGKNLIQIIKEFRKCVDLQSSDSENGEMDSKSDPESRKSPVHIPDSGIEDPTELYSGLAGPMTSTPKPRRQPDCVIGISAGSTNHYELSNEGLEEGSLPMDQSENHGEHDEHPGPSGQHFDYSDRVRVGPNLLSGPPPESYQFKPPELPPELQGELPCDIFYINEGTGTMQTFKTFNELSEYLVDAAVQMKCRKDSTNSVLQKLLRLHLDTMGCYLTVGEYLRYLYEEDKLVDVAVHVQDKTFSAHRIALSCYSGYFAELFSFNTVKKLPFEMKLKGIYPEAFAAFLEFIYTGKLNIYDAISADLIIIADFLKVEVLKKRCMDLCQGLPLDQALKLVVKCEGGTTGRIYRTVFQKCIKNFAEVTKLPGILEMDINTFCVMLASDDLFVHTEFEVFQMAVRWLAHNIEERIKFAMRIISLIRFHYMTLEELYTCAETTSLIRNYDHFREAILKATWIVVGRSLQRDDPFKFPMAPPRTCYLIKVLETSATGKFPSRSPTGNNSVATAGHSEVHRRSRAFSSGQSSIDSNVSASPQPCSRDSSTGTNIRKYVTAGHDPSFPPAPPLTSSARHAKPVMIPVTFQSTGRVPSKTFDILVVGGHQTEPDKFVERFDTEDNQWIHFCRLPEPRIHHAVVVLENTLYLIGGCDPRTPGDVLVPTCKVFSLDLTTKKWKRVADMTVSRRDHCACTLSEMIYVIGGRGQYDNILGSVECFNPVTDNWFFVSPLSTARACASACSLHGRIFVVGGLGENACIPTSLFVLNSVEVFCPSENSWSKRNPLRFPRSNVCLVNVRDRLFLCGGATRSFDCQNSVLVSVAAVDEYIEGHDKWCHRTDMIIPRHDAGVTVAGDRIYIVGGISSTADRVLQSVECYDTQQALWLSGLQDLPYPCRWICCVSILSKYRKASLL